jgi:hypothetical protein
VLQPDFRFWKAWFAGKQCAQSRMVISHCLTVPHSSAPHSHLPHRCCVATSVSQKGRTIELQGAIVRELLGVWTKNFHIRKAQAFNDMFFIQSGENISKYESNKNVSQYNTIQYNTIQYNTIQYNTIQYNTIQYNTNIKLFPC